MLAVRLRCSRYASKVACEIWGLESSPGRIFQPYYCLKGEVFYEKAGGVCGIESSALIGILMSKVCNSYRV